MNIKICSVVLLLNSFSSGILVPVMPLLFLSKGLNLSEVALVSGIYSLAVICLEVPTGVAADLIGRKRIFLLSSVSSLVSLFIIFLCDGIIMMAQGIIFYGVSRALSSGSLDALYIDWYSDIYGKEKLAKAMTNLSVIETAGLALGAIMGGVLPSLAEKYLSIISMYDLNIIIKIILIVIISILTIFFIREYELQVEDKKISVKVHMQNSISVVKSNRMLVLVFISVFSTGFFLFLLEKYWQLQLLSLLPNDSMIWILGIVSCIYFFSTMIGNLLIEKISTKYKLNQIKLYKISRISLALVIIIMAMQNSFLSFIGFYALTYLIFGAANISEGFIINSITSNENRASILSFNSLIVQIGSIAASFSSSILINYLSIKWLWIIGALAVIITIIIFTVKVKSDKLKLLELEAD